MMLRSISFTMIFSTFILQCSETITVKAATLDHLNDINNITHQLYHQHFKPIFSLLIPADHNLEDFMNKKIITQQNANKEFIIKQLNQEKYGLIIAQESTLHSNQIIGYCRFNQKRPHNVHIYFLGINELFRRNKIGSKLLFTAINTFDDITHCTLRVLAHNDTAHAFYQKHGFCQKELISLDLITGIQSIDPIAPITHAEYYLEIKK
jgi:ribosomal protein S18 acetylase RimI-like enzyme